MVTASTTLQQTKMKKGNKQCLLDTPRTVLGKLKFEQEDLSFEKKISVESVQTKIINSFMHMCLHCIGKVSNYSIKSFF